MVALVRSYSLALISDFLWCGRNTCSLYFGGQLVCIVYSAVHNDPCDVRQALLLPRYKQSHTQCESGLEYLLKVISLNCMLSLDSPSNSPYLRHLEKKNISFPKTLSLSSPDLEKAFSHGYLKPICKLQKNGTNLILGNMGWIWPPSDKTDSKVPVFIFMSL